MRITLFFIVLALLTLSQCRSKGPAEKGGARAKNSPPVIGFVVKPTLLKQEITAPGTLRAMEEVTLTSEIQGRVVAVHIQEGRPVKAGTLLVKLSDSELQAQRSKLEALLQVHETAWKRQDELLKKNAISQADFEQATYQRDATRADWEAVKAQIAKTEIRAPFDGVVGLANLSVGAQVNAATPITVLRSVSQLKLDFSLPEKQSSFVRLGQKVFCSVSAGEKVTPAVVTAIEPAIDAATRNRKFRARLSGTNDPRLLPGAFVMVQVSLQEDPGALMVPTQCILPQDQKQLVAVGRGGKVAFIPVQTGSRQAAMIQIVQGLQAQDTIAASGLQFLKEGMAIKFVRFLGEPSKEPKASSPRP